MQSVGPYRFTHILGTCPVGKAWAAIDEQGRFVTVAVLNAVAANTPGWREAFAGTANAMSQRPGGQAFTYADFFADEPWAAYPAEAGPGAEKLFRALGQEYHPVPTEQAGSPKQDDSTKPVSGVPRQPSGPPQSVSGPPHPVSAPPQPVSGVPQPVSGAPQPTSGAPIAPWALHSGALPTVPPAPVPPPNDDAPQSPAPVSAAPADPPPYDPFRAPVRRIKPSEPPPRRTGLWVGLAAVVLVVAVASGVGIWAIAGNEQPDSYVPPTGASTTGSSTVAPVEPPLKPWAQASLYSPEEKALAVAAPSLVFVEAVFTGYVRDARTNALVHPQPVSFIRRCSGFLLTPDGHAVTNGSCVKPAEARARWLAVDALARTLVQGKQLPAGQISAYVATNLPKVRFTGVEPGTEPTSAVYGQLNRAKGNAVEEPAIKAEVVRSLPEDSGNTALIKLARGNLPAVELNPSASLAEGSPVRILAYATSDVVFRNAAYRPQSRTVTITGTSQRGPVSIYLVNEDLGPASHGGVALDSAGRVAGLIYQDQAAPDRANRAILPASTISALLGEAGVANTLGDADKVYRSGLDAYFRGDSSGAVTQLQKAATAAPDNLLAQAYRQNATERQRLEDASREQSGTLVLVLVGCAGVLLVALVILAVLLIRRRDR
ncbi:trypsin-like peptidase domain-containing protein [Micromonospora sp. DT53]|uniref:trypsin-like peptidase domain-containing protein n=1 Tax=Micromonospora sp. DT53 TaxID=3393444 RepID=UPI003CE6AF1D